MNPAEWRKAYQEALENPLKNKLLQQQLRQYSDPIAIAYMGISQMLSAKDSWNPLEKLRLVKKGMDLVREAVEKQPQDLEIRFLRFSAQLSLPSFLQEMDVLEEDRKSLLSMLESYTTDTSLKSTVIHGLIESGYCTTQEKVWLKKCLS
jgi:hypothetical protein